MKIQSNFLSVTNFPLYSQVCARTIICWCIQMNGLSLHFGETTLVHWHYCLKTIRLWCRTISVHHLTLVTAHKWSNIGLSDHQTLLRPSLFGVFTCVSGHCIWSIKYWTIFINCYIIWHQIAGTANQVTKVTGS